MYGMMWYMSAFQLLSEVVSGGGVIFATVSFYLCKVSATNEHESLLAKSCTHNTVLRCGQSCHTKDSPPVPDGNGKC